MGTGKQGAAGLRRMVNYRRAIRIIALIETADNGAWYLDGPVAPTWENMSEDELRLFFRSAYRLAKTVKQQIERDSK